MNSPRYVGFIDPPYTATFVDDTGAPLNLTGCTPSSFTFSMLYQANGAVKIGTGTWSVTNAPAGIATYQYSVADMNTAGLWLLYSTVKLPAEPAPREADPDTLVIYPGTAGAGTAPASAPAVGLITTSVNYTVMPTDVTILCTQAAPITITLPNPAGMTGRKITIKDASGAGASRNITISAVSGTIDSAASKAIITNYGVLGVVTDGTNWFTFDVTAPPPAAVPPGQILTQLTTATSYTVLAPDDVILCNQAGAITITLPNPSGMAGRVITVKDRSGTAASNAITVSAVAGTIDGAAAKIVSIAYGVLSVVTDGTNWYTLAATVAGGGGSSLPLATTITTSYTVAANDGTILCNQGAAITVTLPNPAGMNGRLISIKDEAGNAPARNITVATVAGTIDGAASKVISIAYGVLGVITDGTNWYVLAVTQAAGAAPGIVTVNTSYTVLSSDTTILCNQAGAVTITVPNPSGQAGRQLTIKDKSGTAASNAITIASASGNVDGSASKVINSAYGIVGLITDGTNWFTTDLTYSPPAVPPGQILTQTTITTSYTVLAADDTILCNQAGVITVTIPNPAGMSGRVLTIKDKSGTASTNTITVTAASGNIDGAANKTITLNYGVLGLVTDGTNWFTLAQTYVYTPPAAPPVGVVTTATSYTIASTDTSVLCTQSGAITITLPNPSGLNGRRLFVKDESGSAATNVITIATAAGLIDGSATKSIALNYGAMHLITDGTNWYILSQTYVYTPPAAPPIGLVTITGNYTVASTDTTVLCNQSAAITVTLPTATSGMTGRKITVKDDAGAASTNTITVSPASGLIDGAASKLITVAYGVVEAVTDGTNWFTIALTYTPPAATPAGVVTTTTNYTVASTDTTILCNQSGAITVTLPTPVGANGRVISVKDEAGTAATNTITVATAAGLIDGSATKTITVNYGSMRMISDNANWYITAQTYTPPALVVLPTPQALYEGELSSGANATGIANTVYLVSVSVVVPVTLVSIRLKYATGGNGHYDVGIYDATGTNGKPGSLLGHAASSNTALVTSTAILTASMISNVNLAVGRYWLAYWIDNNVDSLYKLAPPAGMAPVMSGTVGAGPLPALASSITSLVNSGYKPILIGLLSGGWS